MGGVYVALLGRLTLYYNYGSDNSLNTLTMSDTSASIFGNSFSHVVFSLYTSSAKLKVNIIHCTCSLQSSTCPSSTLS